ncbi:MAG: acetoacetate decarboxylase family protein [Candidatus Thorarchaeota archaeon]
MGLVPTSEELKQRRKHFEEGSIIGDVKMVFATFLTEPKVVKRVLPPPLESAPQPTGFVYVAEFGKTNFGLPYNEAGVFLSAQYQGKIGKYCISMPVTVDMSMCGGRETQGYPKKLAEFVAIEERGNYVTGTCIRRGKRIITLTLQLEGPYKEELPSTDVFTIKAFPNVSFEGFQYPPLLIWCPNDFHWNTPEIGTGRLTFGESPYDPIHEIPVNKILLAGYGTGIEIWMRPGEVLAELDPATYDPYYYNKQDWKLD